MKIKDLSTNKITYFLTKQARPWKSNFGMPYSYLLMGYTLLNSFIKKVAGAENLFFTDTNAISEYKLAIHKAATTDQINQFLLDMTFNCNGSSINGSLLAEYSRIKYFEHQSGLGGIEIIIELFRKVNNEILSVFENCIINYITDDLVSYKSKDNGVQLFIEILLLIMLVCFITFCAILANYRRDNQASNNRISLIEEPALTLVNEIKEESHIRRLGRGEVLLNSSRQESKPVGRRFFEIFNRNTIPLHVNREELAQPLRRPELEDIQMDNYRV